MPPAEPHRARAASASSGRIPIISGNWKMHNNHFEAIQTVQKLSYLVTKDDFAAVDVTIHPPFTDIRSIQTLIEADELLFGLGAQNCHWQDKGAFTGEISPVFLAKLGVRYVICGHSERRELFAETDEDVNKKVHAIAQHGMTPIMCVGETLAEREAGGTEDKVLGQVRAGLAGCAAAAVAEMVIAYEPIWAIGTGRTATADDAQAVCGAIRRCVGEIYDQATASGVRIQYGGSVKAANIAELMSQPDVDGALVGGASLDPDEFARIVQFRNH
ncbi:MAG TPA: triose-phosphate isomerase [Ilumatobacteraceae bacterium]|nr:triose-phosphate isomerase [Ilumatobacteraceae bacterium]